MWMIRKTLASTKRATWSIDIPRKGDGFPSPSGTGFFVSPDGWFITARHVIRDPDTGELRAPLNEIWLQKEPATAGSDAGWTPMVHGLSLGWENEGLDVALLKADLKENSAKDWLKASGQFPFVAVSTRSLEEGEPVYSFGYPLPTFDVWGDENIRVGVVGHAPRTTSAVVASLLERTGMAHTPGPPREYVIDKALNYGNSGGPIVATETGDVHAICSRFQPVLIPQPDGRPVWIPSLYGVVSSLGNREIITQLEQREIPLSTRGDMAVPPPNPPRRSRRKK